MLDNPTTFYERIGGFVTVDRLVDAFYGDVPIIVEKGGAALLALSR